MPDNQAVPAFDKSPADLVERFRAVVEARPALSARKMFGYPAAFVNGNLTTSLHQATWLVRLSEASTAELTALGGGPFEPMPGRPMRGYTTLPAEIASDAEAAGVWVDRAIDYVATLPPK